jgi:hypothetical protein
MWDEAASNRCCTVCAETAPVPSKPAMKTDRSAEAQGAAWRDECLDMRIIVSPPEQIKKTGVRCDD